MRNFLGMVAMLLVSAASFAQGPEIKFKTETIDYGTVVRGKDDGVRTFEFTNIGNEPLVITNVKSSCGCTVPSKPEKPVLPGESGKIDVKYNMAVGRIAKTITVESNAKNVPQGRVMLRIKGEVVAAN